MSLTSYSDSAIVQALIDYKINGLSGDQAAKKHGLPHRNTVYRANNQYKRLEGRILELIPLLGFTKLLAKERGGSVEPLPVTMDEQGKWRFIGSFGSHDKPNLEFFVKVGDRLVQL
ncbi:hypothetical protein IBG34_23315 (plasmid) [Aeromonas media]|uniref:Uncharacterized protein n=1 Tax=Aeromonas caviae TaxID=648 RepID=A0A7D5UKP2_AERCA|nr:hypothetical protein [Aeromonas caviae]QLI60484.1 hypothetical protein C1C91_23680 [Aeromonas caviae]QYK83527.1 hypothetical protein IBG34_23315 [Aeromonas media]